MMQDVLFSPSDTTTMAIARYWGAQKIQNILSLIAIVGEKEELVNQVIALSIKYSVLTPYTAFLVVEPAVSGGTGVDETGNAPLHFALLQNYPNPFNPTTTIRYTLPFASRVELKVYDVLGREVRTLVAAVQAAGVYHVVWDGRDAHGLQVPSGVYFYRLSAGANQDVKSMILMR
jgi:hypothetical protein